MLQNNYQEETFAEEDVMDGTFGRRMSSHFIQ